MVFFSDAEVRASCGFSSICIIPAPFHIHSSFLFFIVKEESQMLQKHMLSNKIPSFMTTLLHLILE
jgi:hypothetical protein